MGAWLGANQRNKERRLERNVVLLQYLHISNLSKTCLGRVIRGREITRIDINSVQRRIMNHCSPLDFLFKISDGLPVFRWIFTHLITWYNVKPGFYCYFCLGSRRPTPRPRRGSWATPIAAKGRFTRYNFVACDKLTTSLRHESFRVNQTYNLLTIVAYDTKNVVGFWNMF